MRIIILTSSKLGTAAHHLPLLLASPHVQVVMVIYSKGLIKNRLKYYLKKCKKILRIGIRGSIQGFKMRRWYSDDLQNYFSLESIDVICTRQGIPFHEVDHINSPETLALFQQANIDIGVSLGNSYISKKIFMIPQEGMINIHHEILPQFQNAQSVIWSLYHGSDHTGYTIHRISTSIDAGDILFQETLPIQLKSKIEQTVSSTYAALLDKSASGLVRVLENYQELKNVAVSQAPGKKYTTPSWKEWKQIMKNHTTLLRQHV